MIGWERVETLEGLYFLEGYGNSSNIYLFSSGNVALIDTGNDYTAFIELSEIAKIDEISSVFLTHSHNDHSLGLFELLRAYSDFDEVVIYVHEYSRDGLERRVNYFAEQTNRTFKVVGLRGGEKLTLGDYNFEVLWTPGHTADSLSLYCKEEKVIFSGDSISTYPIYDEMLGGSLLDFIVSLRNIRKLELKAIFPGHTYYVVGDVVNAILDKAYERAIVELNPDKTFLDVAISALKLGLVDEAEYILEKKVDEADDRSLKLLASIKADKGKFDEAVRILNKLVSQNDFEALYIATMAALKAEKFAEAVKYAEKALKIKDDKKLKVMYATALYELGDVKKALSIKEFRDALSLLDENQ